MTVFFTILTPGLVSEKRVFFEKIPYFVTFGSVYASKASCITMDHEKMSIEKFENIDGVEI